VALAAAPPPTVVGRRAQPPPATPSPIGEEEEMWGERTEKNGRRERKRGWKWRKMGLQPIYTSPIGSVLLGPTQFEPTQPVHQAQHVFCSPTFLFLHTPWLLLHPPCCNLNFFCSFLSVSVSIIFLLLFSCIFIRLSLLFWCIFIRLSLLQTLECIIGFM